MSFKRDNECRQYYYRGKEKISLEKLGQTDTD